MTTGRGKMFVDLCLTSDGDNKVNKTQEQGAGCSTWPDITQAGCSNLSNVTQQAGCSNWPDVTTAERKSSLFKPINDAILSPSIISVPTQKPSTESDDETHITGLQNNTSGDEILTDDDEYIPNTSDSSDSVPTKRRRTRILRPPITIDESSETDTEKNSESVEKLRSRKRLRRPNTWKCNIRRKKALSGKLHTTQKGNTVPAKVIKPPCSCKKECSTKINEEQRGTIFENYWNEEKTWDTKRQYILTCVRQKSIERRRIRKEDSQKQRNITLEYRFLVDQVEVKVCKTFFLGTLGISETVVRNAVKKSSFGIVEEDKRGKKEPPNKTKTEVIDRIKKHIERFPKYESHYSREKTGREYLGAHLDLKLMYKLYVEECTEDNVDKTMIAKISKYRDVFNTCFNLGFKPPDTDTCDDCDRFVIQIRGSQESEKDTLKSRHDEHLKEAKTRYDLKANDKFTSIVNTDKKTITVDLQKCLPTPLLTNGLSFYLRKLWTFNYTILDSSTNKSTCIMWDESQSGRGGNELSSGLIKWFEKNVSNTDTKEVTVWSDNFAGQNKNIHFIMCYLWLLRYIPNLQVINHKYLMKGHTHMEVDGVHSIIERKKKKTPQFSIMTPWDWQQLIRSCTSDKASIEVVNMSTEDFKNLLILQEGTSAPFVHRKKGDKGQSVPYSEIVWMQFTKEDYGTMSYKTCFGQKEFEKVSLIRNRRRSLNDFTLPALRPLRLDCKPITSSKYLDLQKALQWVPPIFHDFYKNLAHNDTARDLPEPE